MFELNISALTKDGTSKDITINVDIEPKNGDVVHIDNDVYLLRNLRRHIHLKRKMLTTDKTIVQFNASADFFE